MEEGALYSVVLSIGSLQNYLDGVFYMRTLRRRKALSKILDVGRISDEMKVW
jgi:hypothetical protein